MFIQEITCNETDLIEGNSVFSSSSWLNIFDKNKLSVWGVFNKNKEIIGCFHTYNHKRGKIFKQLAPAPLTPNNGLYVINNSINPSQKNSFDKKVTKLISAFLLEQNQTIITYFLPTGYKETQSFLWDNFEVIVKYTYQINLLQDVDAILANMSTERRKNIKKATKEGVLCKKEEVINNAGKLIKNTFSKYKLKVDENIIDKVLYSFSNESNTISFVSYYNEKPIATVFCVYDKQTAFYILGGYDNHNKHEGAGALAMWEAIKHAKKKGIKTFDFEGSMIPEIEKYFRGFGGDLIPYYGVKKASVLTKNLLKI